MKKLMLSLALLALTANAEHPFVTQDFTAQLNPKTRQLDVTFPGQSTKHFTVSGVEYFHRDTTILDLLEGDSDLRRMAVVTPDSVHFYKAHYESHYSRSLVDTLSTYTNSETKSK